MIHIINNSARVKHTQKIGIIHNKFYLVHGSDDVKTETYIWLPLVEFLEWMNSEQFRNINASLHHFEINIDRLDSCKQMYEKLSILFHFLM